MLDRTDTPHTIFSGVHSPAPYPVGSNCSIRQFRHDMFGGRMSPLVLVDHFQMTGPTFEPHPHAGMSAVTLMFEDALGEMESLDTVGNNHRIQPGDLHWTLAGRGMVHTQQPVGEPARLDALQIFVNLPAALKKLPPATFHVPASAMPVIEGDGSRLRLVAGSLGEARASFLPPQPMLMVDGYLDRQARVAVPLPAGWNAWIYTVDGQLALDAALQDRLSVVAGPLPAGHAIAATASASVLTLNLAGLAAHRSHFVLLAGAAIDEPLVKHGPFVMNTQAEIEQLVADHAAGRLGRL